MARVVAVCSGTALLALTAMCAAGDARAAQPPITGKLDRSGLVVLAVAPDGRVSTARTRRGRFSIVPPAARVTLHLRSPDGGYAGPITADTRGTVARDAKRPPKCAR